MKINDVISKGQPYTTRLGTYIGAETINGDGIIILGLLILFVSLITHYLYLFEKKKNDIKRKEQDFF